MSGHTPGPWDYACDSGHSSPCLGRVQHSKKACVYRNDGKSLATIASHIANWPDAQLIASAPDLLAALEAFVAWDDGPDGIRSIEAFSNAMSMARAAIARARREA